MMDKNMFSGLGFESINNFTKEDIYFFANQVAPHVQDNSVESELYFLLSQVMFNEIDKMISMNASQQEILISKAYLEDGEKPRNITVSIFLGTKTYINEMKRYHPYRIIWFLQHFFYKSKCLSLDASKLHTHEIDEHFIRQFMKFRNHLFKIANDDVYRNVPTKCTYRNRIVFMIKRLMIKQNKSLVYGLFYPFHADVYEGEEPLYAEIYHIISLLSLK